MSGGGRKLSREEIEEQGEIKTFEVSSEEKTVTEEERRLTDCQPVDEDRSEDDEGHDLKDLGCETRRANVRFQSVVEGSDSHRSKPAEKAAQRREERFGKPGKRRRGGRKDASHEHSFPPSFHCRKTLREQQHSWKPPE